MHNVVARRRVARYRRVLIPLDGSRLAEDIIPYVLNLAEALYMDVVLVRVVPPVTPALNTVSMARPDHIRARMATAHNYLADIAAGLLGAGRARTNDRSIREADHGDLRRSTRVCCRLDCDGYP